MFFFVWVRAVVATIWYSFPKAPASSGLDLQLCRFGVQSYFGSQLLSVLLRCVFGNSWWHMANHMPESAGISSRDLLAFFLFWMLEMPFLAVHPRKIKFLFAVCDSLSSSVQAPSSNAHSGRVCHLPSCVHRCICMVHPLRRRNSRTESDNCYPCQRRKSWMGHA